MTRNSSLKNKEKFQAKSAKILDFNQALRKCRSHREAAKLTGIARTTQQYWQNSREYPDDLSRPLIEFFESSDGQKFLHRLMVALQFVFAQVGNNGLRLLSSFVELSQLNHFAASSTGYLHKTVTEMETTILQFGQAEQNRLGSEMKEKSINACLDETFPDDICLVAIEPVSNFILLEKLAKKRDSQTWERAMEPILNELPITIKQVTSDEASALIKYTESCLGAQHSPDLFHIQQDIIKAISPSLRAKVKQAKKQIESIKPVLFQDKGGFDPLNKMGPPKPCDEYLVASLNLRVAQENLAQARLSYRSLSEYYHPFDSEGHPRKENQLEQELTAAFNSIELIAANTQLKESSLKKIEKAKKRIPLMIETLSFFWAMISSRIMGDHISNKQRELLTDFLLPAIYWEVQAKKAKVSKIKKQRLALSNELKSTLEQQVDWQKMSEETKQALVQIGQDCVLQFQRSSSCVEGRNGQLKLQQSTLKRVSQKKLSVSTTIHNYFIKRDDQTTAAERFFGQKPKDLFEWLVENTDYPSKPAAKRKRPTGGLHSVGF